MSARFPFVYDWLMILRLVVLVGFVSLASCKDDPKLTVDAAETPNDAPDACMGGTLGYLEACTSSTECGSCTCQNFGHTMRCTIACAPTDTCPAPSGGCSTGGFCRP